MTRRKVVMISSTARDLPKHREQVRLACERAGFEPRWMMENLTAESASPVDVSLRMVADADIYLGILAYRYGTIPKGYDVSITELEYDRAVELKKPQLIFFIHKDHRVTIDDVETGPGAAKLKALKERVGEERVAAWFRSPEDLRGHVVEALTKLRETLDAGKTEDATARSAAALHRTTSISAPPESYIAHPYESDATFESFLNSALCYASGQSADEVRRLPWHEREAQLLKHLYDQPYLFVLDGLERILIAYNRMDASRLADDDYDEQTANVVVGAAGLPASAAQSFVGQHRLRQTIDPRAGAFLQKLAQVPKSRILITTRLYPSELQMPTGYPRPGCAAYFLHGLSDDDALGLWRALGVAGSRAELAPIFRSVEGHPLLVQALAGEVANYRKAPGDFAQWRADHPQFDPTSLPLVHSRTHILEFALQGLSAKVREALHTLVGFRMPTSYATLEALLVGPDKACASAQELDRALTELEDRGLIGWDREANRYDAHPIVRGVVWRLMGATSQRAVYTALEAYFEPMAVPDEGRVETLADLTPAIERYHTLVGLGRYDDAFVLFRDRLERATLYRLAAHRERIAWLEALFPDGAASLPALTSEGDQARVLNELALSYDASGQPARAVPLYRRADKINEHANRNRETVLENLGIALSDIGALREAEGTFRQALILSRGLRAFDEASVLAGLGCLLNTKGDFALGHVALRRSQQIFTKHADRQGEGCLAVVLAERSLWLGDAAKVGAWAERAWELAAGARVERDFIWAALMQGQAALGMGDLSRADERLHHALTRARAVNLVELELPALTAIAALELKRGHPAEAKARLDDVWETAERGPYPLLQADAYNVLADIALAEGNKPAAIAAATKACQAAWCDGPPYAYH